MRKDKEAPIVVAEEQALAVYLESLFLDIPEIEEDVVETAVEEVVSTKTVAEVVVEPEIHVETVIDQPVVEEAIIEVEEVVALEEQSVQVLPQEVLSGTVPDWGRDSFQCLLFSISGLTLAVPLARLNGLIERPDTTEITDLPGYGEWYMGVFYHRDKTVKIANTDKIVLPEGMKPEVSDIAPYIILVGDGHWGLRCDSIGNVITLNEDQVKWRSERTKRRWLAGTVIEKMCALVDTDELVMILENDLKSKE